MNGCRLLQTELSRKLYQETAKDLPLIDYHNHLSVKELAEDRRYGDIAEGWLLNDPYKHRAMRICGVDEHYITGNASNEEKFHMWCQTLPRLIGGPLYDWSRDEMEQIFGIRTPLNGDNASRLWAEANEKIASPEFSARGIFRQFNVEYSSPIAALTDDLSGFAALSVLAPSLRGDNLLLPGKQLLQELEDATGRKIRSCADYESAISLRLDTMHHAGCRFSDHSLDRSFRYTPKSEAGAFRTSDIADHDKWDAASRQAFSSHMLRFLAGEYAKRGWTMQLHLGAQRFTSTRLRILSGATGGYAGIGSPLDIQMLVSLLDDIEQSESGLPRMILYPLNPGDNATISILSGSFIGVTQGPAWWWCDHLQGMRDMLETFSTFSVLSTFVGMNTDSRSFLSLLRHDYFRRTFCRWIADKAQQGDIPEDYDALRMVTEAVCYSNAKKMIMGVQK